MWTVILHYDRSLTQAFTNLTKEKAQEMVRIAVFSNQDCVNCSIFRTDEPLGITTVE